MHTDRTTPPPPSLRSGHLTDRIIGVFFDVYNELGPGFLESVYHNAMVVALEEAGIRVEREVEIEVFFRSRRVGRFRADLLVERSVLLELKTVRALDGAHLRQAMNCLSATRLELALLLNFGPAPQIKRVLLDNSRKRIRVHPCASVFGKPTG